jgi:hypothetical protein
MENDNKQLKQQQNILTGELNSKSNEIEKFKHSITKLEIHTPKLSRNIKNKI